MWSKSGLGKDGKEPDAEEDGQQQAEGTSNVVEADEVLSEGADSAAEKNGLYI